MDRMLQVETPIQINWQIKESTLRKTIKDSLFSSEKHTLISGVKYYAQIYPNGKSDKEKGKIQPYLQITFPKNYTEPLQVTFSFSVPTANYSKTYTSPYEKSQGCGGICFTREDLFKEENQYIVDGYMNLQIDGSIQCQKYVTVTEKFKPNDLAESLWNSDNKDFTIIVDGKAIMAHKCILAHRSKYFAAMFNSGMTESKENKTSITGFAYSIVETVIKACYYCDITDFIFDDNINLLLSFMDLHEFVGLKASLETYLIQKINLSNVVTLANSSIKSNSADLKNGCLKFIMYCMNNSVAIDDHENLDDEIKDEIWRQSFLKRVDTA